MPRIDRWLPLIAGSAALMACSSGGGVPDSFSSLASAALEPGESLGSLRLGSTTLREALERHGPGRSSVTAGDEYGFELSYGDGQMSLLFEASPECHSKMMGGYTRDAAEALAAGDRFVAEFAECAASTLRSVAVASASASTAGFFIGSVRGVTLGSRAEAAVATFGPDTDQRGLWLAGSSPADATLDLYTYPDGLVVFVGTAPDGPEKGQLVVRKMAIFAP